MARTKEGKDGKNHLIKSAPFVVAFLSLAALVVYYALSKGAQTPQLAIKSMEKLSNDEQVEITVRPATPADYAYYLEFILTWKSTPRLPMKHRGTNGIYPM